MNSQMMVNEGHRKRCNDCGADIPFMAICMKHSRRKVRGLRGRTFYWCASCAAKAYPLTVERYALAQINEPY